MFSYSLVSSHVLSHLLLYSPFSCLSLPPFYLSLNIFPCMPPLPHPAPPATPPLTTMPSRHPTPFETPLCPPMLLPFSAFSGVCLSPVSVILSLISIIFFPSLPIKNYISSLPTMLHLVFGRQGHAHFGLGSGRAGSTLCMGVRHALREEEQTDHAHAVPCVTKQTWPSCDCDLT